MPSENSWKTKREQMNRDGYCLLESVVSMDLIDGLREGSDRLLDEFSPVEQHLVRYQGSNLSIDFQHPSFAELVTSPALLGSLDRLGWPTPRYMSGYILSKPPGGPPLYWHQDFMNWNHPEAVLPWTTRIFLSYYLTDTTRENGCLRVIPGTHHKRIDLHECLPPAHGEDIQAIEDLSHPVFQDHPDAVDIPVKSEDLVIADARVLHAAWPNTTAQRRTLLLQWHSVFPFPNPPTWWKEEIPDVIPNADPNVEYERTRTPGAHLSPNP
mgnify:CR=1 FL=1